jgi:putative transposase
MRDNEIVPKTVKIFRVTTDSSKSRHPAKTILDRKFDADRPNEKWVADVAYILTRELTREG